MSDSAVTPVILGLLAKGPRSGYEIKAVVDRSTVFFWAASYGQIYPELRRLEREGLIAGEDAPQGARRRRVYQLTGTGRVALEDWLLGQNVKIELRDESLLRVFFADTLPAGQAVQLLETRRRMFDQLHGHLQEIDARPGEDPPFVDLVLRWGLAYTEWETKWWQQQLNRLTESTAQTA